MVIKCQHGNINVINDVCSLSLEPFWLSGFLKAGSVSGLNPLRLCQGSYSLRLRNREFGTRFIAKYHQSRWKSFESKGLGQVSIIKQMMVRRGQRRRRHERGHIKSASVLCSGNPYVWAQWLCSYWWPSIRYRIFRKPSQTV